MPEKRQLAAIMFTDIVGYTALMGKDETAAYQLLKRNRKVQRPLIEKHGGKWLKEIGDGVLASFQTISDAVYCAIEIQRMCKEDPDLKLRIGIHEGEVIMEDGDVFGDGVNIASRLEPLAPTGGIYISESVYRNIKNKKDIHATFIGEEALKNVDGPVRIFEIDVKASKVIIPDVPTTKKTSEAKTGLTGWIKPVFFIPFVVIVLLIAYLLYNNLSKNIDPNVLLEQNAKDKSIAVLPFVNISNDPDQDYFSDGMMEEILNHLFQIGDLLVTSRTSVMKYKETTKSVPEIARELGVSTILEGSVRKAGNRVRITVQLIDGKTDKHLWSESYDRDLNDIFTIQSEVAKAIAITLKAEIHPEVRRRIDTPPTDNLEAYDLYLEAGTLSEYGEEENGKAIEMLYEAIELDPEFSNAYTALGLRLQIGAGHSASGGGMDPGRAKIIARSYLEKAVSLNPDNGFARLNLAFSLLWFDWDFRGAEREYSMVRKIYPSYAWVDFLIATERFNEAFEGAQNNMDFNPNSVSPVQDYINACYFVGRYEDAILHIRSALSDSLKVRYETALIDISRAYMWLEKYEESLEVVNLIRKKIPNIDPPRVLAAEAISYFHLGKMDEADKIIDKLKAHSMDNAGGSPSFYLAMIYAEMQEIDTAFEWLKKAYNDHEVEMYWLKVEPPFAPLRDDPRWQVMLDKIGFPD